MITSPVSHVTRLMASSEWKGAWMHDTLRPSPLHIANAMGLMNTSTAHMSAQHRPLQSKAMPVLACTQCGACFGLRCVHPCRSAITGSGCVRLSNCKQRQALLVL